MRSMREQGTTIVLTSHNLETISTFCSRSLSLRQGRLVANGLPAQSVCQYRDELKSSSGQLKRGEP